jgi:hypothetical protein
MPEYYGIRRAKKIFNHTKVKPTLTVREGIQQIRSAVILLHSSVVLRGLMYYINDTLSCGEWPVFAMLQWELAANPRAHDNATTKFKWILARHRDEYPQSGPCCRLSTRRLLSFRLQAKLLLLTCNHSFLAAGTSWHFLARSLFAWNVSDRCENERAVSGHKTEIRHA